jgi:hypothetical protein
LGKNVERLVKFTNNNAALILVQPSVPAFLNDVTAADRARDEKKEI